MNLETEEKSVKIKRYQQKLIAVEKTAREIDKLKIFRLLLFDTKSLKTKIEEQKALLLEQILCLLRSRDNIQKDFDSPQISENYATLLALDTQLKAKAESQGWVNYIDQLRESINPECDRSSRSFS